MNFCQQMVDYFYSVVAVGLITASYMLIEATVDDLNKPRVIKTFQAWRAGYSSIVGTNDIGRTNITIVTSLFIKLCMCIG